MLAAIFAKLGFTPRAELGNLRRELEHRVRERTRELQESEEVFRRYVQAQERTEAALRESTARFETIANNIPQLAWMTDPHGHIFWYNQNWYDYTGTTLEQMPSTGWPLVHHPDHAARVTAKWLAHIRSQAPWEDIFPIRCKSGEWRWFLSRARPARDAAGKIVHWLGTGTDVTDLRQAREDAVRANQAKDELLSICAHELRTPVTAMKLSTEFYRQGLVKGESAASLRERVKRMLEQLDRRLQRLTMLIDEMLDFSRVSSGRLTLRSQSVDLARVLAEAVERMREPFEVAGSEVVLEMPATQDFPDGVTGQWDGVRMDQVIVNLLTNALKYGAGKAVRCAISDEGGYVTLVVRDQGMGISLTDQARIFRPYERADASESMGGLGRGLYIAAQIVEAHGGTISVESEPGQGSAFIVRLPKDGKALTGLPVRHPTRRAPSERSLGLPR